MIALIITSFILLMATIAAPDSFYDFSVKDIHGNEISMNEFKGQVIMIVNTASKCGFTRQYNELQQVYDRFKSDGFVILGFPANNFGWQEPGTDEEILEFCELNYGVNFPLFSKIDVKGSRQDPLFSYLTQTGNNDFTGSIRWNFEKFLIDRNGILQRRFRSQTKPDDDTVIESITSLLKVQQDMDL